MRLQVDGATEPLFLSSGGEDYFLSAYYFNEGEFRTPNSGLTYYDGAGGLSAYKTHDRDPIFFSDGLSLVWRNGEDTTGCGDTMHCPNQWCPPGQNGRSDGSARLERRPETYQTVDYDILTYVSAGAIPADAIPA